MKISKILIFTVSIVLLSMSAYAMGNMKRPSFNDFDTNNDKQITKSEYTKFGEKMSQINGDMPKDAPKPPKFSEIDTNNDGAISTTEFSTMQKNGKRGKGGRRGNR